MADLPPDDDALLRGLAARDLSALAALYDRHGRMAYALAYRILGESEAAEPQACARRRSVSAAGAPGSLRGESPAVAYSWSAMLSFALPKL